MIIMHDGVVIFCLPDNAFCGAGNGRPIEDIDECPRGWKACEPANCIYYSEEPIPKKHGTTVYGLVRKRGDK